MQSVARGCFSPVMACRRACQLLNACDACKARPRCTVHARKRRVKHACQHTMHTNMPMVHAMRASTHAMHGACANAMRETRMQTHDAPNTPNVHAMRASTHAMHSACANAMRETRMQTHDAHTRSAHDASIRMRARCMRCVKHACYARCMRECDAWNTHADTRCTDTQHPRCVPSRMRVRCMRCVKHACMHKMRAHGPIGPTTPRSVGSHPTKAAPVGGELGSSSAGQGREQLGADA